MTDAQKYASIAFVGSGISVAALATAIAITARLALWITRRDASLARARF